MALIVVVDDRVTNRRIFSKLIVSVDPTAEVLTFSEPVDALVCLAEREPDLVITDFKMPQMDGSEFIRHLRRLPGNDEVPVMVITAYEDRAFRLQALDAGATDFLQSPVDHPEFYTRVRNLLRLGKQQRLIRGRASALEQELLQSKLSHENTIRESRTRLAQVIDTIPAVISAVDDNGKLVFINAYGAITMPVSPVEASLQIPSTQDLAVLRTGLPFPGFEEEIVDRDGAHRTLLTSKYPIIDESGTVRNVLTTSIDITDRKANERRLYHLAHHDALTGLPNRLLLYEFLQQRLKEATRPGNGFALHFIDLDRFKSINDGFGHDHGDLLLKEIARRLKSQCREADVVARLGGDEFAVVQIGAPDQDAIADFAAKLIATVSQPMPLETYLVTVQASIGVTIAPNDASSVEQLLKYADLAMYRAKQEGRACVRFFTPKMLETARHSVLLEVDLRASLERDKFELYFQPQVDIATRRLVGAEALLRWNRPGHGLVSPQEFLGLAEETGLIRQINQWVLGSACRIGAAWAKAGTPVPIAVNISSVSLQTENIEQLVLDILGSTGLDPSLLELEVTEGTFLHNKSVAAAHLHALRRIGVRVAIDDFGTGYSSLAYLQHLPIDRLKVDRSFVLGLEERSGNGAIVEAIVGIGRSMGMEVMAEGVEHERQLKQVAAAGCQTVQGYLFGRPMPAAHFQRVLHSRLTPQSFSAAHEGVRVP